MPKIVRTKKVEKVSRSEKKEQRLKKREALKKQLDTIEAEKRHNISQSLKLSAGDKRKKKRSDKWLAKKLKSMNHDLNMIGAELMSMTLVKGSLEHKEIRARFDVQRYDIKELESLDWKDVYKMMEEDKENNDEEEFEKLEEDEKIA